MEVAMSDFFPMFSCNWIERVKSSRMVRNEVRSTNGSMSTELAMGGPFKIKLSDILFLKPC